MGAVVSDNRIQDERQAGRKQHAEGTGAGQQTKSIAFGVARRNQHRHEHAAQGQNRHPGRAGERSEERADQGRDDGRAATELADQGLEHPHQPFRRPALGKEIARKGKDRNAGEHVVSGEAVVLERNRLDWQLVPPKQNERRAPQRCEHRRAQQGRESQSHQSWNQPAFGRTGRPDRRAGYHHRQREGHAAPAPFLRCVPNETHHDQAEAERQKQLDNPDRNAIDEDLSKGLQGQDILQTGEAEEEADRGGEAAAEDCRRHPSPAREQLLDGRTPVARGNGPAEHPDN